MKVRAGSSGRDRAVWWCVRPRSGWWEEGTVGASQLRSTILTLASDESLPSLGDQGYMSRHTLICPAHSSAQHTVGPQERITTMLCWQWHSETNHTSQQQSLGRLCLGHQLVLQGGHGKVSQGGGGAALWLFFRWHQRNFCLSNLRICFCLPASGRWLLAEGLEQWWRKTPESELCSSFTFSHLFL